MANLSEKTGFSPVQTRITLANNGITTVQNFAAYDSQELTGFVYVDATTDYRAAVKVTIFKNGAGTYEIAISDVAGDLLSGAPIVTFSISSVGVLSATLPSFTGFVSAYIQYNLNAPALGGNFPLTVASTDVAFTDIQASTGAGITFKENGGTSVGSFSDLAAWFFGSLSAGTTEHFFVSGNNTYVVSRSVTNGIAGFQLNNNLTQGWTLLNVGTAGANSFQLRNTANTSIITIGQTGGVTLGDGTANITHNFEGSPTAAGIARLIGNGAGGCYLNWTETAVQDWFLGMDNGSGTFKFRLNTFNGTEILSLTTAGTMTLNGVLSASTTGNPSALFRSTSGNSTIRIDAFTGSIPYLYLDVNGVNKWRLYNNTDDTFNIYSNAGATQVLTATQAGAVTLGDSANTAFAGNNIVGRKNGSTISAGFVGERISASLSNVTLSVSNTVYNAGTLSLTAGVWVVYGKVSFGTAGSTQNQCIAGTGLTSATLNNAQIGIDNSSGIAAARHVQAAPLYLNISTTTTVYMHARSEFTGTAPATDAASSLFYAVRIA